MDEKLEEVWNQTYPVPFKSIVKRNTEGKGVLVFKTKKGKAYIYSYIVFVTYVAIKDEELEFKEDGRNITVRLFYYPGETPTQDEFELKIGKYIEINEKKQIIGWIKKK